MPSIVESLSLISKTMDSILDFITLDEKLSEDFKNYLEINDIEINNQNDFNRIIIQYALDMKMQNGLRVLEYYRRNNNSYDEVVNALLHSFSCVFKVDKVLQNGFEVTMMTSSIPLTLIPLVKMSHLKQIGKNDFMEARIVEINNVQYILEIYDVLSEYNVFEGTMDAIKYMLQNPKIAYYKNDEIKQKLVLSAKDFYEKFIECFKSDFIVTTNKEIDDLIEYFNKFRLGEKLDGYQDLIEEIDCNKYINVKELNCSDSKFLANAFGGFSTHKETYDVGLWIDKKRGLYVIPFLKTFFNCFREDVENAKECICEFLTSDKIPPGVIKYAKEQNENFFDVVNKNLKTNFNNLEEILFNSKTVFLDEGIFSPVLVLFNSDLFSSILKYEKPKKYENIGRNDPCPCGSGLKYKKCCGKSV